MTANYLTREGHQQLQARLDRLRRQQRTLSKAVGVAAQLGDLRENAEYQAAKEQLQLVLAQIAAVESKLCHVQFIDELDLPEGEVALGATVVIREVGTTIDETYMIVSANESNPSDGKLSVASPMARGLLGHKAGEQVSVDRPGGTITFEILSVGR